MPDDVRVVRIADIKTAVCREFGIPLREMTSARRSRSVARPRQVAMFMAKQMTAHSLPVIGREFGGRDHTTVMQACRRVIEVMRMDLEFCDRIGRVRLSLAPVEIAPIPDAPSDATFVRAPWSYPDDETLSIVRAARADMLAVESHQFRCPLADKTVPETAPLVGA